MEPEPEPEPVAVEPEPEPVDVEPEPVAVEPEPVEAEPDPVEPQPEPVDVEPEPVAVEPEPVEAEPDPVEPEPEPVAVKAEPEPVALEPEPEPEAVVVEAEPELVQPEPEPEPTLSPATGLSAALAAAALRVESEPEKPFVPDRKPSTPEKAPEPERGYTPAERLPAFVASNKPKPPPKADDWPAVTEFAPRKGTRTIAGVLLSAALIAAGISGYLAWQERTAATLGILVTLFILVLVIWATRASSEPAHLKINSGHLTVQQSSGIRHFDLASKYTPLTVKGRPGLPGWKVIIEQRDQDKFVINSSMVEPKEFMRVLRYYRPDL